MSSLALGKTRKSLKTTIEKISFLFAVNTISPPISSNLYSVYFSKNNSKNVIAGVFL